MGARLSMPRGEPEYDIDEIHSLPTPTATPPFHHPSEEDVTLVRTILLHLLPFELVDVILNLAMYWPRVVTRETKFFEVCASDRPNNDANFVYLVTPPILVPSSKPTQRGGMDIDQDNHPPKIRLVRFSLFSHDQGWGGEPQLTGPYHGSYTWFEAGIYRFAESDCADNLEDFRDARAELTSGMRWESEDVLRAAGAIQVSNPINNKRTWFIQRNVRASPEVRQHTVTWKSDGGHVDTERELEEGRGIGFVRSLVTGDRIVVMARALYPGWANHVHSIQIEMFYSV